MVEPTVRGGDVALFIDWENFKISLAAGNRSPNLSSLKEEVSNQGRVVVAKAYADWVTRAPELRGASQFINDPPSLYAAGIEPVFVPTRIPSTQASTANGMRTYRVKNSVDVKMTADCIECAHSYPNIGTFVLVSGDSDFLHVVNALRTMGKQVVIIGVSWSTSRRLADQVDSLLLYDKDVDPIAPQPAVLPQHAPQREAQNEVPELAEVIRAIEDIIREERGAGSNPLLTSIKQRLMRRYPSFDEKKLGFSGFKKLMARAAEDGNIKLIHAGLVDWAIMADEETPEGTTEESPSGVAARPSRRRGGRRRGSGPRDAEGDADADTDADTDEVEDEAVATPAAAVDVSPVATVVDLEETAATDFDLPEPAAAEATGTEVEEDEESVPWFDPDEEPVTATIPAAVSTGEPEPVPETAPEGVEPEDVFGSDAELAAAVQEVVASLSLPPEPADGQNPERISDLIVMADHLEHRQGARHVAFTYLVDEVCDALEQGLEAGVPQIAQRWTDVPAKDYVSKAYRGLSDSGMFKRSIIAFRVDGQRRQRRIINLVRDHDLIGRVLTARLGPGANTTPPNDPPDPAAEQAGDAPEPQPVAVADAQPEVEQLSVANGDAPAGVQAEPEPEPEPAAVAADPETEPEPAAVAADPEPAPAEDVVDDEPQPASVADDEPQPALIWTTSLSRHRSRTMTYTTSLSPAAPDGAVPSPAASSAADRLWACKSLGAHGCAPPTYLSLGYMA